MKRAPAALARGLLIGSCLHPHQEQHHVRTGLESHREHRPHGTSERHRRVESGCRRPVRTGQGGHRLRVRAEAPDEGQLTTEEEHGARAIPKPMQQLGPRLPCNPAAARPARTRRTAERTPPPPHSRPTGLPTDAEAAAPQRAMKPRLLSNMATDEPCPVASSPRTSRRPLKPSPGRQAATPCLQTADSAARSPANFAAPSEHRSGHLTSWAPLSHRRRAPEDS
jgi:hypothetical protein